jgi:hypothetical protein
MRLQSVQAIRDGNPHNLLWESEQDVPSGITAAEKQAWVTLWIGRLQTDQVRPQRLRRQRPFPDFGCVG